MTDSHLQPLNSIYDYLQMAEDGIWYSNEHKDLGFLENDNTDWERIQDVSFWYRHRERVFAEVIKRYPPKGSIYEIGAGDGSVAIVLQNNGYDIVAIEPTVRCARTAKRRGVKNVICSSIENTGFNSVQFPNVGLFDVLEHIDNDIEFLSKIRKSMSAGGRLYCAVPAYHILWSKEDDYAGHCRRYTSDNLCRKIKSCGFEVEYKTYYFKPLIAPIFLLRTIPSALHLRGSRTPESSEQDHSLPDGFASRILNKLLCNEVKVISNGGSYLYGASFLMVAKAC